MARLQNPSILSHLRSARTYVEQASALRALKNEVVGHVQKKESWVKLGALEPVVKILATCRSPAKQVNAKDNHNDRFYNGTLTEDEAVRLQVLQLLSSFASAGPPFLAPLHAAGALPAILANISPFTNPPNLVLAALKALAILADAAALVSPSSPCDTQVLSDSLFTPHHIDSLQSILATSSPDPVIQSQITLAAGLVSKLCTEESHRHALAKPNGVLDALATRLASFAVAEGQVIPGAERQDGMSDSIPEPAPQGAKLGPILEAIATVVADSRYRAFMLLTSPSILAVFPIVPFTPSPTVGSAWHSMEPHGTALYSQSLGAMDYLLPAVPPHRSARRLRPKSEETRERKTASGTSLHESTRFEPFGLPPDGQVPDSDRSESPLVPWLIVRARSSGDVERLMAMSVLIPLFRADFATKGIREATLGLVVVPTFVQLLRDNLANNCQDDSMTVDAAAAANWKVLERAPALLARLITDNENLQQAAFDCNVVEVLTKLLQESYKSAISKKPPMWTAKPPDADMDEVAGSSACRLGPQGHLPLLVHRVKIRESALKAIASTSGKEECSKAYVDLDVLPYIVESLSQFPGKPLNLKERAKPEKPFEEPAPLEAQPGHGQNPRSVIIAACHTIRMLSRSVGILRTALVDYGIFGPMFRFLRHPDIEIQIVATAVVANLVLDVSPMREPLVEQGVMKILCEHAHSLNASLRLNALWALKHLMYAVGTPLKKKCLEELEPGWLVRLICDDTEDEALVSARSSMEKSSVLDADEMDEDVDMQQSDEPAKGWLFGPAAGQQNLGGGRTPQMEARLARYRESESNPVRKARNDDLAIQEQGLHFIRNLIMGTRSDTGRGLETETTEMIDFLFTELGQDRLFEILSSKLRVKVLRPLSRRSTSGRDSGSSSSSVSRVLYPQTKIIEAVIFILVHMAASAPRHRQVVIAQTSLLQLLGSHFSSKDKEVRVALCHLISNLTWQDSSDDVAAVAQRATELRKLGFVSRLEALAADDPELDVKERAKSAMWQVKQHQGF